MGYDIELKYENAIGRSKVCEVSSHTFGSTYVEGGKSEASCGITYNYFKCYQLVDFDIKKIHGQSAKSTIPELKRAIELLGTKQYEDYWAPTPGNAGYALSVLLEWAELHPFATWSIT